MLERRNNLLSYEPGPKSNLGLPLNQDANNRGLKGKSVAMNASLHRQIETMYPKVSLVPGITDSAPRRVQESLIQAKDGNSSGGTDASGLGGLWQVAGADSAEVPVGMGGLPPEPPEIKRGDEEEE